VDDKQYEVQMDDWMYQMDERTLINRTSMSKFGVEVGQVTLFFRKEAMNTQTSPLAKKAAGSDERAHFSPGHCLVR
jgi:oligoribonuclease (3'-5' exoribonuclease)